MIPSVEDVVARWEARPVELIDTKADVEALIAAWRARGEALEKIANMTEITTGGLREHYMAICAGAHAALKDTP